MTPVDFSVMFLLGLVGSLHCVQMCGPIVLSYSVALESLPRSSTKTTVSGLVSNHLAYNFGRVLTYSLLGAIAGLAGETISVVGRLSGLTHILALVAGVAMTVVGIAMFGILPNQLLAGKLLRVPSGYLQRAGKLIRAPGVIKRFMLGLMLGFLPCGLIYAALLRAIAAGGPAAGAMTMFPFGLGTASALLVLGMFSSAIRLRFNRWGSRLAAAGITLMGVLLVWRGTMPVMMMEQHLHVHH